MRALACFALAALLPAALGTGPASARTVAVALCSDGQARTVEVPFEQPGKAPRYCPDKACHGGAPRKQTARNGEPTP